VAGDRVLARMGRVVRAQSRVIDVAARLGGDEFVVLMPGCDQAGAESFADRVRRALANPASPGEPAVRVSAGTAATAVALDVETLLERADRVLYAAKRAGRDQLMAGAQRDSSSRSQTSLAVG
jgi:diguanylate cyclase (GGDEF)-like protein